MRGGSKTWQTPVNQKRHDELLAEGWRFVESRHEWEFAVSKYVRGDEVLRVTSGGQERRGEK